VKPWEPDPEGDKEFAETDYPLFGEKPEWSDLTLPDESCWEEIDKELGYGPGGKPYPEWIQHRFKNQESKPAEKKEEIKK